MSYDLYFLRAEDSADPAAFLEQLAARQPAVATSDSRRHAVVEALKRADPTLELFSFDYDEIARSLGISIDEARRAYSHVELNGPGDGNGVQITVHDNHVTLTIAYWHGGSEAARVFSLVARYAAEIAVVGRYRTYDPQLERVVGSFDEIRADALNAYAGIAEQMPNIVAASQKPKPWWKFW